MKSMLLVFTVIAIIVTSASLPSLKYEQSLPPARVGGEEFRLPNHSVPLEYALRLIPYEDTFDGEVDISVTVIEPTSTITLHAEDLEINTINVTSTNFSNVPAMTNTSYDEELHFYTLTFATAVTPGDYLIHIEYAGQIRDDLTGFYRSYYNTSSGQIRWYVSSFFAPIYARRAFPCFDEPALKARFNISIAHWPNETANSNALLESTSAPNSTIGNRVWTKFATTPLMSTYLVAFMVSDFTYISNNSGSFRIWSRPEALDTATYSLASVALLNQLSTYTGISYESLLSKMDQVALPISASIAMENWGLITYNEAWILWQDGESTTLDKQNIETIIAHEFAHQWFGNLVTPEWWNYVWLSEGFASYFEFHTAAEINPSWQLMDQFTVDFCHGALLSDSFDSSRPMNQDVYSPDEVKSSFDVISYKKGACVLWMLSNFLGEGVFQTGLQMYLSNNSYGTGNPDKLWDALTDADDIASDSLLLPHVDIKSVMNTWTNQKGYPVVTVTRNYTQSTALISQERFLINGRGSSNDTEEYSWWIPINFASQSRLNFSFTGTSNWIRAQDESIMISGPVSTDWVIYNVQQTGFYRVNYDDQNWNMIAAYLRTPNFTNIPAVNRAQLIDDAFNLARAGYVNYSVPLSLIQYLTQETDHVPWVAAFDAFAYLQKMMAHSPSYRDLQRYLFARVAPIHASLGYTVQETDKHVTSFLRPNSHTWACRMACPGCLTQSHGFVRNFYESGGNSTISVDLRGWAYCEGLRNASDVIWNFMWDRYLATDLASEQTLILSGLGCSLNEDILNRYLNFSISENSGVRSHHRLNILKSVYLGSPFNVDVALNFLLTNITEVSAFYGGPSVVARLLQTLGGYLVTKNQLIRLQTFVSNQNDSLSQAVSTAAQRAVEAAEQNIAWLDVYEGDITRWLAATASAGNSLFALSSIVLLISSMVLNLTS